MKFKSTILSVFAAVVSFAASLPYGDPTSIDTWEKSRQTVVHPAGMYLAENIESARKTIKLEEWARQYAEDYLKKADKIVAEISPDFLEDRIPYTSPNGGMYGPCPACRALGRPFVPNGTWKWDEADPDHLLCTTCNTVFPNADYPEEVVFTSKWDPRQTFSFMGGDTFDMYGNLDCRPSISGMIRSRKVLNIFNKIDTLTYAYIFSGELKYAQAIHDILVRFSEVMPHYLFCAPIYSEIADCDPHIAVKSPYNLPSDEITTTFKKADRKLAAKYWQASRIGTAGMDGRFAIFAANAYDVTVNTLKEDGIPLYSEQEKIQIEKDLLIEMSLHLVYDDSINNKSVGNRAGAALVGKVCGQPDMARFGLDGFIRTIDSWFLPDCTTSESAAYATMTMNGIYTFAYMFRDYTEPENYEPPQGSQRLEHFNAGLHTAYGTCWQNLILTLQGNMCFPPIADSYKSTAVGAFYADLIAQCCPIQFDRDFSNYFNKGKIATKQYSLLFGDDMQGAKFGKFVLPDIVFPYLGQAYFRTGENGMDSAAILNASDWGGHHHLDSLNLILWHGDELLNDLGYLWDHPDKKKTVRTMAHNLVVIDEKDQNSNGRGGEITQFQTADNIKIVSASSNAYGEGNTYKRTLLQVSHHGQGFYWLDLFEAMGGSTRDYVFHGPNNDMTIENLSISNTNIPSTVVDYKQTDKNPDAQFWKATWKIKEGHSFSAFVPFLENEQILYANEWGQRDSKNLDRGTTLPYFFRRRTGDTLDRFATVFYSDTDGKDLVKSIYTEMQNDMLIVHVKTSIGEDTFCFDDKNSCANGSKWISMTDASIVATLDSNDEYGHCLETAFFNGSYLKFTDNSLLQAFPMQQGKILDMHNDFDMAWFEIDRDADFIKEYDNAHTPLTQKTLFVNGEDGKLHAYPILDASISDNGTCRIFVKTNGYGFPAVNGTSWQINSHASVIKKF